MASLLNIALTKKPVTIDGQVFEIHALSARAIANLAARFQSILQLLSGGQVDVGSIINQGGDVVGAIIAAGLGKAGDEAHEQAAADLPIDMQVDFLAGIIAVTLPGGVDPFIAKLKALGGGISLEAKSDDKSSSDLPVPATPKIAHLNGASHNPAAYSAP
jgi:hypothetical protein